MDRLEALAPITRLSQHVLRVVGQNPGKFTLQGTNTYILGSQNPYILLDTGQEDTAAAYISFLRQALSDRSFTAQVDRAKPLVSDIVLSHWHNDHIGGLSSVLTLLRELAGAGPFTRPRIHKFPLVASPSRASETLRQTIDGLPRDLFVSPSSGETFHDLTDGQTFSLSSTEEASIEIIHIPGHTADSIAIFLPSDDALYTSDTVLGAGTAVFEDLALYIASLRRLLARRSYTTLYPGHGPTVAKGKETIEMYINHRLERESQVLVTLKQPPLASDRWSTWTLVQSIYASYPESLWLPAAHGIDLHLKKLEGEGVVRKVSGEGKDCVWEVVSSV